MPEPLSPADLDRLEALEMTANPAPWTAMPRWEPPAWCVNGMSWAGFGETTLIGEIGSHDAELIAAARNVLLPLIAEVRRLRAEVDRLRARDERVRVFIGEAPIHRELAHRLVGPDADCHDGHAGARGDLAARLRALDIPTTATETDRG